MYFTCHSYHSALFKLTLRLAGIASSIQHRSPSGCNYLLSHLPASYLTESDGLADPENDVVACIDKELDVCRLAGIHGWLWLIGRPLPPSPLHDQLMLDRRIFATERMDMHLVWTTGRIYIKPLPRFLLAREVWTRTLSFKPAVFRAQAPGAPETGTRSALHEIDLRIAKEKGLLPPEAVWASWKLFVHDLHRARLDQDVDPRFIYGELRLSRLNQIYKFGRFAFLAIFTICLSEFVSDNFAWLASATWDWRQRALSNNDAFQAASYGFAVFTILGPLIAAGLIILAFCYIFVDR
ncbi:hypothetical protein F5B18DRAFT_674007 [Nemania serpens]|nr:hypothetical protein F5B18DRAFT_674007 [Nemania serpens]